MVFISLCEIKIMRRLGGIDYIGNDPSFLTLNSNTIDYRYNVHNIIIPPSKYLSS